MTNRMKHDERDRMFTGIAFSGAAAQSMLASLWAREAFAPWLRLAKKRPQAAREKRLECGRAIACVTLGK